jgi:hypothetical protein
MFETIQHFIRTFNNFYEEFQNLSFSDICPFVITDFPDFDFCTSVPVPSEHLVDKENSESDSCSDSGSDSDYVIKKEDESELESDSDSDSEYVIKKEEESELDSELESDSNSDSQNLDKYDSEISVIDIRSDSYEYHPPRLVSIEGNIGSGKSTLIEKLKKKHQNNKKILFLQEPVGLWE